jgi:putative YhbY family RNA-binding protein
MTETTTELTTELSPVQRRALRADAHHLKPVVSISQKGLTPSVLAEIDRCLTAHELIKLRLYGIERDVRDALFAEICTALKCASVQHIGNLLVLWRANPRDDAAEKSALATRRKSAPPATKKQAAARTEARNRKG